MNKILVVDDEEIVERLISQRFRKEIKDKEFEFIFARDGVEALELLKLQPGIDCIISDINMPKMDGLTLLTRIQEINPLVKTVMISAYGDMPNIRSAMNHGAFDFLTKPIDFNDLRLTIQKTLSEVNSMKKSLHHLEENQILKSYVNPAIFRALASFMPDEPRNLKTQRIEATVAFIDVCGFTRLSEQLDAENIRELLNLYFDLIAQETLRFGGHIDKFIGDAALVVFEGEDHLVRAVKSIKASMERIEPLLGKEMTPGYLYPNVSAGLSSGQMISGNFGSQTLKRFDFTVIGDVVNIAARIESLAAPGQLLVTDLCSSALSGHFSLENLGEFKVYNKEKPLGVTSVLTQTKAG